ncbi:MAG: XylR family transcriptional regulator [Pirellulales bacterium]|nr:XylR family transcriptional regulator [Pirellulales bacterium]
MRSSHFNQRPRIAVLVDTSTGWGRRVIRGIYNFVHKHGPWDIWLEPRGQDEDLRLPRGWTGDGIIARISTLGMARHLRQAAVPTVNVSGIALPGVDLPRVTSDNLAIVQLALNHFTDLGIRSVGYIGLPRRSYSLIRQRLFVEECQRRGVANHVFHALGGVGGTLWERQRSAMESWLASLPKPVGVLTWGIKRGIEAIDAAVRRDLRVPDDVAVLAGDDDDLLCRAVRPTLSGIIVPAEQIGHDAAQMLDRLLKKQRLKERTVSIPPTGIASRNSTDVLAMDDVDVVAAVRFIREHAHRALLIDDVAHAVATSRRSLERRFQKAMGRTLGEEIARAHLDRARSLLETTDLPIPKVADNSGYGSPEYMACVFRSALGVTPLKYRMQSR